MIKWIIDQPFNLKSSGSTNPMSREQGYVDLAVLTGEQVDNQWKNSDREAIMQMRHLEIQSIGIDDLWKPTDQFVVVRGVAGIGKSTLIQRYVLKWAREEILNGKENDQKIDFLFFFECRELNTMPNLQSVEELLKVKYPEVFDLINVSDLQNIAGRIMIIVDGLDELQGVYDKNQEKTFVVTEIVKEMINPKSHILKGHKTIVGGRHNACESIRSNTKQTPIKLVEVCGFRERESIEYIDRFFGSDVQRANKVKEKIKQPNIRIMSNVPVLMFVICLMYSEDFEEEIKTVTELYVYGLVAFLKNHIRVQENPRNVGLSSFVTSQQLGKMVYSLSTLSVKTYMNGEVVFTDDDIKDIGCDFNLEATGLIIKHSVGNFDKEAYQFKHLVFQEFLCALHLCLAKGVSKFNTNRELSSCTSTILGIHHLLETKNNQLFLAFYRNMEIFHKNSRKFMEYIKVPYYYFTYNKFITQQKQLIQKYLKGDNFDIYDKDFKLMELMRNFRENNWLIDEEAEKKILNSEIRVSIGSLNKSLEVLEFLRSLNVVRLSIIRIFWSGMITGADLELIRMVDKSSTLQILSENIIFISKYHSTSSLSSITMSCIVPNEIKSLFNKFLVHLESGEILEDYFDNIFFTVSDLIEYVLENKGNKKLEFRNSSLRDEYNHFYELLLQKVRSTFGQREYFENITMEG